MLTEFCENCNYEEAKCAKLFRMWISASEASLLGFITMPSDWATVA